MLKQFILIFFCLVSFNAFSQQKDTVRKQYLGMLTLTEKFREEKNWTPADQSTVGAHFERLKKFVDSGIVVLAGRTSYETNNPEMVGLVIFHAKDDAEADQFMKDDPAVKAGIMNAKTHPYSIALHGCK